MKLIIIAAILAIATALPPYRDDRVALQRTSIQGPSYLPYYKQSVSDEEKMISSMIQGVNLPSKFLYMHGNIRKYSILLFLSLRYVIELRELKVDHIHPKAVLHPPVCSTIVVCMSIQ